MVGAVVHRRRLCRSASAVAGALLIAGCIAADQEPGAVVVVPLATGVDAMLLDVHFVDESIGFAVGSHGALLRSDDSGATWDPRSIPGRPKLNVAGCLDGRRAYVGSMEGRLFATEDGGQTWSVVREEPGRALIGSARRPGAHDELWISGERGLLLRLSVSDDR